MRIRNDMKTQYKLQNLSDTQALAEKLAKNLTSGVVFLAGDLGAGKTTLVRFWLQALGHMGRVKSPTYTLVEPYHIHHKNIFHFDLYRLNDPEELDMMGFQEYLENDNLVIIEWPSKAGYLMPQADVSIEFTTKTLDGATVRLVDIIHHQN